MSVPSGKMADLLIIEKDGWSGKGFFFHKDAWDAVAKQSLIADPGVYILWGEEEDEPLPLAYIGESENPGDRLKDHAGPQGKEFWQWTAVFSGGLNKAHVKYVEASLVDLAERFQRCKRDKRNNTPHKPTLGVADEILATNFFSNMLLCLPIIGVNFFEEPQVPSLTVATDGTDSSSSGKLTPVSQVELLLSGPNKVDAKGFNGAEFVVLKGSKASKEQTDHLISQKPHVVKWRETLVKEGVLYDNGETLEFTKNYAFGSPSLAAAVCLARSANGRTEWRDANGTTLAKLEDMKSQTS